MATKSNTKAAQAAPEEPKKERRDFYLLGLGTESEFNVIDEAAKELGCSRSSLIYALIHKATKGFTEVKPNQKLLRTARKRSA